MAATPLALSIAIGITLTLQVIAIIYALRLVKRTKYNAIWVLCIIGFILIALERWFELLSVNGTQKTFYISITLGIGVSFCISFAVLFAHRLVRYIERVNRQRALLNRRILTAVLRAEEQSRLKFSKELHDGLGPLLSSAKMSLSALSQSDIADNQREIISNTKFVIDEAIRSVREISNNLSPQVLIDFGLAQAIHNFTTRCATLHGVTIEFKTTLCNERFDSDVEVILYRVTCELINNSLKHSGCSKISLNIEHDGSTLSLLYADNGCGFDPEATIDCGMGLSNISSRISSLGGNINIRSSKGGGMSATISITLNGSKNG